jgi:repressor LexA
MGNKNLSLAERCEQVLELTKEYKREHNNWPTERDLMKLTGLKSPSNIDRILKSLEENGQIGRRAGKARGIFLKGFENQAISIPMKGTIAASNRNPAVIFDEDVTSKVEVAETMLKGKKLKDVYALKVQGDSMEGAMIRDGDVVFLEKGNQWSDGDIVAVWLNNENAVTLKMIYQGKAGVVKLKPASHKHQTRVENLADIVVQGRMFGLIRAFS